MRRVFDDFIEIRRNVTSFGKNRVIDGLVKIGHHSVLVLIHCQVGHGRKTRIQEPNRGRVNGFRKVQRVMQLAHKFSRPVVVCYTDPTSLSCTAITELHEALGLSKHILSQWYLKVPIILVVLTTKIPIDIFNIWLADKVIILEDAQFVMNIPERGKNRRIIVNTEVLMRGGFIDKTIPAPSNLPSHSQAVISYRLGGALTQMLDEVSHVSPRELIVHRRVKLAQVEAMILKLCGLVV